jgi:tetratricopeptide (TPR) repeat protein
MVYYYECNYDKALSCYEDSLDKYKTVNMTEQIVFAHALTGLGYVYHHLSQDIIALEHLQRALQIFQRLTPFKHPDLSRAHRHVATVLCQMGDYDGALHSIKISLEIGRQVFPRKSLAFGMILNSLGKVLYKKGNYEEALEQHLAAIEINRCTLPQENSLILVLPCNNIGKIFYRRKNYSDAAEQYDKVISILTTTFSSDHIYTAYTFKNKGELLLAQNALDNAADYLSRSCKSNSFCYETTSSVEIVNSLRVLNFILTPLLSVPSHLHLAPSVVANLSSIVENSNIRIINFKK